MKYLVKSLHLGGSRNAIHHSGDIVTQAELSEPAEKLIEKGFIEPYESEAVEETEVSTLPAMDDMTKDEICERLEKIPGLVFKSTWKKESLYSLLEESVG